MKRITLFILLFAAFLTELQAQINVIFVPEVYGRTVDGLGVFKIQKLDPGSISGFFIISVKENVTKSSVLIVKTPRIIINSGLLDFPRTIYTSSAFNFSSTSIAAIANQTRNFVPGEYTYCYKFIPDDKSLTDDFQSCFDASIQPVVPIGLLNPVDRDTICQKRPLLTWQPPMPYNASIQYRLLLTEKKAGSNIESLLTSMPLLYLDNIRSNSLIYPTSVPELKEGHTYCWQVVAYQQGLIISKSEIWEFTVQCIDPLKSLPFDSYREIKTLVNGNYYIAAGAIKFAFYNSYTVKKLNYKIIELQDPKNTIKDIPLINLQQGLNKIDIDLRDLNLKNGGSYLLKVFPFNEPEIDLRFVYKEPV